MCSALAGHSAAGQHLPLGGCQDAASRYFATEWASSEDRVALALLVVEQAS